MSDFQKVRVTFRDADGKQVSAAMWALEASPGFAYLNADHNDLRASLYWLDEHSVTVTPISDLPTGAGAVIRVLGAWAEYGDVRDVYISDQSGKWWSNNDGDCFSKEKIEKDGTYEVLSEGVQL